MDPGRPDGDCDEGHVDEERGAPRERVDEDAADERPENRRPRGGGRPDPEGAALLLAGEGRGDERERAGNENRARRALEDPRGDEELHVRRDPAQDAYEAEADEADEEQSAPSVEIRKRAREDEERGQREEVAVVDVRLSLEDAEDRRRQLAPDPRERDVHNGRVDEHDRRAKDRRDERPPFARVHDIRSPASIATASLFDSGASGHTHFGSKRHDGW